MYTSIIIAGFSPLAMAAPSAQQANHQAQAASLAKQMTDLHAQAAQAGCNWGACIGALAGETGACATAAASGGTAIPLDIACLGSIVGGVATKACDGCP